MCENVDFIVVVHVRVADLTRRQMWRKTYGSMQLKDKVGTPFDALCILFQSYALVQIQYPVLHGQRG